MRPSARRSTRSRTRTRASGRRPPSTRHPTDPSTGYDRSGRRGLLTGRHAPALRQMAVVDSRISQETLAVARIRDRFCGHLRIDEIAAGAGMSASSLHAHFKSVTRVTPPGLRKAARSAGGTPSDAAGRDERRSRRLRCRRRQPIAVQPKVSPPVRCSDATGCRAFAKFVRLCGSRAVSRSLTRLLTPRRPMSRCPSTGRWNRTYTNAARTDPSCVRSRYSVSEADKPEQSFHCWKEQRA